MNTSKFADLVEGMVRKCYAEHGEWLPMAFMQLPSKGGRHVMSNPVPLRSGRDDTEECQRLQGLCLDAAAIRCATAYEAVLPGSEAEQDEIDKGNVALEMTSARTPLELGSISPDDLGGVAERVVQIFVCSERGNKIVRQIPIVGGKLGPADDVTDLVASPYLEVFNPTASRPTFR